MAEAGTVRLTEVALTAHHTQVDVFRTLEPGQWNVRKEHTRQGARKGLGGASAPANTFWLPRAQKIDSRGWTNRDP